MRATYMYGAGDVRVIDVPEPTLQQPTDALVRVTRACVCGSDLHPYHSMPADETGSPMGHEFVGVVEETGTQVTTLAPGDFVIAPFAVSCGACEFCRAGLQTSCVNGGFWNDPGLGTGGGQAEAVRVPLADGTLDGTVDPAKGLRPHRCTRGHPEGLRGHGRAHSPQGAGAAMTPDRGSVPQLRLNNGLEIPALGFGVFQTPPAETIAAVETALVTGYRHIDTAAAYGNEREVGEAIRSSGLDRSEIFIETKIWITDYGYDETLHAFDKSAGKLGIDRSTC